MISAGAGYSVVTTASAHHSAGTARGWSALAESAAGSQASQAEAFQSQLFSDETNIFINILPHAPLLCLGACCGRPHSNCRRPPPSCKQQSEESDRHWPSSPYEPCHSLRTRCCQTRSSRSLTVQSGRSHHVPLNMIAFSLRQQSRKDDRSGRLPYRSHLLPRMENGRGKDR